MQSHFILLIYISIIAAADYKCSDNDCYECVGDTCHLTCQGNACSSCPSGNCCDSDKCNVCISSACCSTAKCNDCVKENRKSCYDSPARCNLLVAEKCGLEVSNEHGKWVLTGGQKDMTGKPKVSVNQSNHVEYPHNITTVIKIQNMINNTNVVDTPILLNLTNVEDISINKTTNVHLNRKKDAAQLRHKECSSFCGNSTNLLIKNDSNGGYRCIIIGAHPYYYCGYYAVEDCSACYNCEGKSQIECLEDTSCSPTCRRSVLPKKFYNTPYHINRQQNVTEPVAPEAEK
ncbi:hypothetical protein NQ317_014800 [Molorchus minor]|uniref:Uncharacterized protein n=1 Tax=Molorchus minor TaxID=1323400 RepID=A0ABQ9IVR6_9CUCU|nr:hypothetical protein NQ317_014800 [Molorchus minor]